ncbi:hypothetical protein JTE90_023907 [Oedothorax gibbosus]|uniref:Semaphorin-2A n=1 Tax=Oedothorax gibbosus TaxID=931172 RepID=A0AAV6ULY1_9ARAC|nr:hypothetical protein JTE90_023907 [Oedothorax gibbosus]
MELIKANRFCAKFTWIFSCAVLLFLVLTTNGFTETKLITRDDMRSSVEVFSQIHVKSFGQLLFDIQRYQLIVGARDYLFRLSLEGLKKMEEAHWPAAADNISTCLMKGKSEDECMNYIKVLVSHGEEIFVCGTNAFYPECSRREIQNLNSIKEWVKGEAKCPHSPHANSTALMTSQGDYYIASSIDFSEKDSVIFRGMGKQPVLRTIRFDPKWLSDAKFVASYEIDNFTYYFFREDAVEYINCGKVVYSRIARVCKNDQGGQFQLKDKFTTFLKARLNCSVPGNYPFYFNEIQSVYYIEREEIFYATFTTPINSIYGTAICAYNMTSILSSFSGDFKYQKNPTSAWERQSSPHKHFQCEGNKSTEHFLDSERYQLMNKAVQPMTSHPILKLELERFSHIVVDTVPTKNHDSVHVMFVASVEGIIQKLVVIPETKETCLIEQIKLFPEGSQDKIKVLKLLKDTNSLYIGTEESVLRILVHRCERMHTKNECLSAMDPYCGWNEFKMACTSAPHRNPLSPYWHQEETACPRTDTPVDGGWSPWGQWFECSQVGRLASGDRCLCQRRLCNSPSTANGGRECEGTSIHVSNCTRNGQWTEWSSWSSCSQTCGLALKTRRRVCGNPAPAYGGKICIGTEKEEIYCTSNPPCPASSLNPIHGHWSEWSTWEQCSANCGGGIQVRRRRCNSPPPQNGGRECSGCNQDYKFCNLHNCPEVKKATPWTPYLRLNQTRDGYYEQRLKFVCKANVPDESMLRIGHVRKEERFCKEGSRSCQDSGSFSSVDGGWGSWTPWSPCSASCGGGVQYRERVCDSPRPTGGGTDCPGPSRVDHACNMESCHDLEGWEPWSAWSLCDDDQEQSRKRKCKIPLTPTTHCVGPTKEIRMCIPSQLGMASQTNAGSQDDGVYAAHVIGAFITGLLIGIIVSGIGLYIYVKRKRGGNGGRQSRVATKLIPVKPNTYVDGSDWKNNFSTNLSQKIPLREATIKRNGSIRTQLQSENF